MVHKDILSELENQYQEASPDENEVYLPETDPDPDPPLAPLPPPRGSGWRQIAIGIGVGVAATLAVLHFAPDALNSNPEETQTPAAEAVPEETAIATQTVTVAPVELASVERTLDVTGSVEAYDLLPVLPQATGLQIQQVLVDEGDIVSEGQVMAILDDSVVRTQIARAEAEVESARSGVRQREANLGQAEAALAQARANQAEAESLLVQNQARVAEAKANLEQARREVERYQELSAEGVVSRQELETRLTTAKTAEEAVRVAEANVAAARAKISSAQANVGSAQANVESARSDIRTAEAGVRSAQAQVEQLNTQRSQSVVRAPMSGIVAERTARVGDVTGGNKELFSIIAGSQLELHAKVPETQLSQVKIGAPVTVTSDADRNLNVRGTVREIAPLIDPNSREATVKINLPPVGAIPDSFLRPGMFLRAAIATTRTQGMKVPAKAIVPQADGRSIVYRLLPDETVEATTVEVGKLEGRPGDLGNATVEIKRGLEVGDRVVISGASYLKDGDRVNVVSR